jgi:hypothetical protein
VVEMTLLLNPAQTILSQLKTFVVINLVNACSSLTEESTEISIPLKHQQLPLQLATMT